MEVPAAIDIRAGTRLLLEFWKSRGERHCDAGAGEKWESFLAACEYHQVSPIVFHRLQDRGRPRVPSHVTEQLRARFYRISAYNHRLSLHLVQLVREFDQQRIPCLALKGPAVALAAYGDLSLRQYEDIDVMVRVEDVSKAVAMLFGLGFQPARGHEGRCQNVKLYHEVALSAPDRSFGLDLHWQLAPPYAQLFGPNTSAVWGRSSEVHLPTGDVPGLSAEDLLLTLCQHGTRHRWWQLKWLFDVAELFGKSASMDWAYIEEMVQTYPRARASAGLAAVLAQEMLGVAVPAEIHRMLAPSMRTRAVAQAIHGEFLSLGRTNGSAHDTLLGLEPRALIRAKYLAIEAVQYPLKEILFTITEKDHQFVRLPARLTLLYFFIRPFRLMVQHGRVAARRIWSMAR